MKALVMYAAAVTGLLIIAIAVIIMQGKEIEKIKTEIKYKTEINFKKQINISYGNKK